jgi:hypothetical protein
VVAAETRPVSLMTFDTVIVETPARAATSAIVTTLLLRRGARPIAQPCRAPAGAALQ